MTERKEVVALCLTYPGAFEDYPFDDANWTVMRRGDNRKGFAWIFERDGHIWVNVKCDPDWAELYRQQYESVIPAYHMNKRHWNSIILDGNIDDEAVEQMISESFALCGGKNG